VVHAEVPAGQGVQRGLNFWINLAAKDKMYAIATNSS
jgi:redox-sensitive bicupin YhaK (pirin superfamily)